jgi:Zn-finger nucleic acid-binding protein
MNCPVCKEIELRITDRQGIEIDYCPQCRGVWLDRGELDKLIERSGVPAPQTQVEAPPRAPQYAPPPPPQQHPHPQQPHPQQRYEKPRYRDYDDDDDYKYRKRRKKGGWLEDLFDFD